MNKINCLIVDDEAPARDELAWLLTPFTDIVVHEAGSAGQALEYIREHSPDLVFQDIQMPERDGFDVLREACCVPRPPLFVFVTAYDRYAVRAFEKNAVDYLLKPVTAERLQMSVERVRGLLAARSGSDTPQAGIHGLLEDMAPPPSPPSSPPTLPRLTVERNGRIQLIGFEEVVYCEVADRKILVHTRTESFPCHGLSSLDEIEARARNLPFFRINRSAVVNLNMVREFSPWTGGKYCIVLDDDGLTELTLSRSRVRDFKLCLGL